MCGRYVSPKDADIEGQWHIGARHNRYPDYSGILHFNAAPTQLLPIVRQDLEGGLELLPMRWGLIPSWAKDWSIGTKMINARSETVAEKPAFRAAFKRRRCLVPMLGFYEWKKVPAGKVPHFIHLRNGDLMAAAGLYEFWPGKDGVEPIESYTIITTAANEFMAKLHDRMPVFLAEKDRAAWLDPKNEKAEGLQDLLKPYPTEGMDAYPVSTRVNSPKNDDADLLVPAGPPVT
jgi:putative SOS response-associated peptidase YedK